MKSTQRHAATAAGFLALSLAAAPLFAQARVPEQRGGPPGSDTPYILIATFKSPDRQLGVQMADELRKRLQSEHAAKELYVVPKNNINNTLEASGYRPDSALNTSDLMELAKQLRGEQVIDGTVTRGSSGVHVDARLLMRTGQQTVAQPLPPVDAKDPGDAAKQLERSLSDASKAIPSYKQCTNALRAAKYDDAKKFANAGLAAYSNSTISRLCLLSAHQLQKAPADSIISVAKAITAADPTSLIALANLADAYNQKGDTAKAIETNLAIYKLDPSNTTIAAGIIQQLATSGAPDKALPIVDSLLKDNPGDAQMLRTKWLLLLRAGQFKQAIATGEEYVKADTSAATLEYFQRQIGAAQSDSNAAMVQQLAAKAAQKFPTDASLHILLAQNYRKAGQLQQALAEARRAIDIDPKNANAWLFAIVTMTDLNQPDSAMALAQKALAAGADKQTLGQALLATLAPAVKKAQESKARADWEAALKSSQAVDEIAPSPNTKFYIGVSAFSIGIDALQNVQALSKKGGKADKAKACEELKVVEDNFATASIAMPAGGSVDKDAAGQILSNIGTYGAYVPQFKKALSCK